MTQDTKHAVIGASKQSGRFPDTSLE